MEARHITGTTAGTKMRLARHVENEDTWQRYVEVETHRHQDSGGPKGSGKGKGKKRTLEHVCAVERKDTRKQIANSRLQHVQTAERVVI